TEIRKICFFGGYESGYPRSEVLRKGLEKRGVTVSTCRSSPRRRGMVRAAILTLRYLRMRRDFRMIYVPEFRHKDVPLAYVLGRLTGKRVVFDPLVSRYDTKVMDRGDAREGSYQAWHNRNLDRISLGLPDLVLADTKAHARYYEMEFKTSQKKLRVLPVGFDEDLFPGGEDPSRSGEDGRGFRVLFFGNYLPLHGVDVVASAAKMLREYDGIDFELIGRGQTFPAVERFVTRERLDNIRLLPRLPLETLASSIAGSSVCLGIFGRTAKTGRVVPNKVYQSMAMGKPVITGDTEAVREFFEDSKNICLVPPDNPEALAEKIHYLYMNREVGRRIGEEGAREVRDRYSSLMIAGRFLEFCREILG
ncbi:MAG: glycosyltransferase, partial [Candidatus Latescibacterota bacterium]